MSDIERIGKRFIKQEISLVVATCLVALLVMRVWYVDTMLTPIIVSVVYSLTVGVAVGLLWMRVAKRNAESLPTFFTALSGGRLLLALTAMFVYYLVCGRDAMLVFFLVFMAFYLVTLVHQSVFFAKVSSRT